MKKRTRNILIAGGVLTAIFAGILLYGAYSLYSFFSQITTAREIPDDLKEARITKGAGFLTKTEFFSVEQKGLLKTISDSSTIKDEKERQKTVSSSVGKGLFNFADIKIVNEELIAVSQSSGYVFDKNGNLKREIFFEPLKEKLKIGWYEQDTYQSRMDNIQIVELEKNKLGFLSFGGLQGVRIFDENGNEIWNYGKEKMDLGIILEDEKERDARFERSTHVLQAAVGDLDGDGIAEYIVAKQNDGMRVFDRNGNEKWFQADKFPNEKLYVTDINGDNKNEIVAIGSDAKIRDGSGNVTRQIKGSSEIAAFLISDDKDKKVTEKALTFCRIKSNRINCDDENRQTILQSDAPLSDVKSKESRKIDVPGHPEMSFTDETESVSYPKAVWVNLRKDEPKYLAVVAAFIGLPRANFYLYDEKGNLVYHELLPEDAETVAVIPAANERQEIIIGGKNTIWRYALN